MYRVTMQTGSGERLSVKVANQDLARMMALAARLQFLNPEFEVNYSPEYSARDSDAA